MKRLLTLLVLLAQICFTSNAPGQSATLFETLTRPEEILGDSFIIRLPLDERKAVAKNTAVGNWKTYEAPAGTKVSSVYGSEQIGACVMRGDPVLQLCVFHAPSGNWSTFDLAKIDRMNEFRPIVGDFVACFVTTEAIIAYSVTKNCWSRLAIKGNPQVEDARIIVKTVNATWIFDGNSGRWKSEM